MTANPRNPIVRDILTRLVVANDNGPRMPDREIEVWLRRLGTLMRLERERAGLTLFEVAHRIGASSSTIKNWERASSAPSLGALLRFSDAIGVTIRELLP